MVSFFLSAPHGGHRPKSGLFETFRARSFQRSKNQDLYPHRFFRMTKTRWKMAHFYPFLALCPGTVVLWHCSTVVMWYCSTAVLLRGDILTGNENLTTIARFCPEWCVKHAFCAMRDTRMRVGCIFSTADRSPGGLQKFKRKLIWGGTAFRRN